jgi:hypothetical protein
MCFGSHRQRTEAVVSAGETPGRSESPAMMQLTARRRDRCARCLSVASNMRQRTSDSRRSAPRPPPPPEPPTFSASAHVTGLPARDRPRRRPAAPGHVPTGRLVAPFSGIDAAQQAQQGHQLRNLPATVRAIGEMTVERGTLRLHETAYQVGAQREADVVILSAHHVTAPRKTSDRTTCPLTIPGAVRFTAIPACGPGHRHRS